MQQDVQTLMQELLRRLERIEEIAAMPRLPTMLTKKMAAHELSIGLSTLKGLIRRGDLLVTQVGGRTMVPVSQVRKFLSIPAAARGAGPLPREPLGSSNRRKAARSEAERIRAALKSQRSKKGR